MPEFMPADDPRAPKYWPNETSGILAYTVMRYLEGKPLTTEQVKLMRLYLEQWVNSPAWDLNPEHDNESRQELADVRAKVREIKTALDLNAVIKAMESLGLDPL